MATPQPHDPQFMLKVALEGFNAARGRFLAALAVPSASAEQVFVPLTEALWWTVSVDEGFEEGASNLGTFRSTRNSDADGRVLLGLRYVRDRCSHQRALAAEPGGGLSFPISFPMKFRPWTFRWRPVTELPPPNPKFNNPKLEAQYTAHLVGESAADSLDAAARWFETMRQQYGL